MTADVSAIRIRGLKKTYGNGVEALKGIDLDVQPGDFFALLGPNGAGKSTTIGILSSLVTKSAGAVQVFGHDIDRELSKAKQCLGVVPQEFNFGQFEKVLDIVVTQAGYYGMPKAAALRSAEKYLKALGLWEKRNDMSRTLSGGMKRRLMIARALVHEPKVLILDEPTAGVDIELRRSMWDFLSELNRQGITIILTTHYLEEAESLCRRIAIIDRGLLVENTDMKTLLAKLHVETFLFDSEQVLPAILQLQDFVSRRVDDNTLEVSVNRGQSLNAVFAQLEAAGITVRSMRNKANRLEELFLKLVDKTLDKSANLTALAAGGQ